MDQLSLYPDLEITAISVITIKTFKFLPIHKQKHLIALVLC